MKPRRRSVNCAQGVDVAVLQQSTPSHGENSIERLRRQGHSFEFFIGRRFGSIRSGQSSWSIGAKQHLTTTCPAEFYSLSGSLNPLSPWVRPIRRSAPSPRRCGRSRRRSERQSAPSPRPQQRSRDWGASVNEDHSQLTVAEPVALVRSVDR